MSAFCAILNLYWMFIARRVNVPFHPVYLSWTVCVSAHCQANDTIPILNSYAVYGFKFRRSKKYKELSFLLKPLEAETDGECN